MKPPSKWYWYFSAITITIIGMQPGETITPGAQPPAAQQPEQPKAPPQAPSEQVPAPSPAPSEPAPPESNWQFTGGNDSAVQTPTYSDISPVSWTASEYIAHNKGPAWFAMLGIILFAAVVGIYFVTDMTTAIVVGVAGIAFGVFAARPPRVLQYTVDAHGIRIGDKAYAYSDFRSFDISDDSPLPAVLLMPLKRFLPPITVFYDQREEDAILNVIGSYLPHEEQKPDAVDRLMRRIRF